MEDDPRMQMIFEEYRNQERIVRPQIKKVMEESKKWDLSHSAYSRREIDKMHAEASKFYEEFDKKEEEMRQAKQMMD